MVSRVSKVPYGRWIFLFWEYLHPWQTKYKGETSCGSSTFSLSRTLYVFLIQQDLFFFAPFCKVSYKVL